MSLIRKLLFIVVTNFLVFLLLLTALAFLPPAALDFYELVKNTILPDPRAVLPNYKSYTWAKKHFDEFSHLKTIYYDFIGWRRKEFHGETINIDQDGYRRYEMGQRFALSRSEDWFFGGSTMWGTGVKDSFTIAAYVQQKTAKSSFNFGESGYTSHQSLNLLIKNYLLGGRPRHVIFYDGVNEVSVKCRSENSFYSTAEEPTIRERLNSNWPLSSMLSQVFSPTIAVFRKISEKLSNAFHSSDSASVNSQLYDCHANDEKTKLVARSLVLDWTMAKRLVEEHGGKFFPMLQPVAYIGAPNLTHLQSIKGDVLLRKQYEVVYREIIRQLNESNFRYYDFSKMFDGPDFLYIDFCHVSPEGNERVAEVIAKLLAD